MAERSLPQRVALAITGIGLAFTTNCGTPEQIEGELPVVANSESAPSDLWDIQREILSDQSAEADDARRIVKEFLRPEFQEITLMIGYRRTDEERPSTNWHGYVGFNSLKFPLSFHLNIPTDQEQENGEFTQLVFNLDSFQADPESNLGYLAKRLQHSESRDLFTRTTAAIFNMPPGLCWRYHIPPIDLDKPSSLSAGGLVKDKYLIYGMNSKEIVFNIQRLPKDYNVSSRQNCNNWF